MSGRSVVLLDAGNTLFTEREARDAIYAQLFAAEGVHVPVEEMARLRREVHDAMLAEQPGRVPYTADWFRDNLQRLLVRLDCGADAPALYLKLAGHFSRPENFVVHADAHPALEELLARGLRLGLVSNWSEQLPGLLQALDLWRYFEVVAVSATLGHTKPDRAIFHWTLDRLGARPDQALHVGDHPVNDVAGARRAGLAALLLDRAALVPPAAGVIRSLDEIPAHLLD